MIINKDLCIGCKACVPYCPMGAILEQEGSKVLTIDQDECVECNNCREAQVCPVDALEIPDLKWPRILRRELSDPAYKHSTTGLYGRGTSEMKSNDVTGRFKRGEVGFGIEVGRPGVGADMKDVERIVKMLIQSGVEIRFEEKNPCTSFITDKKTGDFQKDILGEKVMSIIIEFSADSTKIAQILKVLEEASKKIDTVFSISMITRAEENGELPNVGMVKKLGYKVLPNPKTNIGLGRPYKD